MKMNKTTTLIAYTSLMTALVFVTTRLVQIPLAPSGYIHFGDAFIFLSCFILPAPFAVFASGVGSCLADLTSPFAIYTIPTLVVKGLMGFICRIFVFKKSNLLNVLLGVILASVFMQVGYFFVEIILYGTAGGFIKAMLGSVQTFIGIPLGVVLIYSVKKIRTINQARVQMQKLKMM